MNNEQIWTPPELTDKQREKMNDDIYLTARLRRYFGPLWSAEPSFSFNGDTLVVSGGGQQQSLTRAQAEEIAEKM